MTTIILLNIIVILISYIASRYRSPQILKVAFIILSCILSIRYGYGNDYFNYYDYYIDSNKYSYSEVDFEIGWYFLCKLCAPVGYMGFVILLTCFSQYLIYRFIKNNVSPKYYWFAVFIYVFQPNLMLLGSSMMRQFFVMAVMLNLFELILNKEYLKFIIGLILCFLIHKITILYIPLLFVGFYDKHLRSGLIFIPIVILFFIAFYYKDVIALYAMDLLFSAESDFSNYFLSAEEGRIGIKEMLLYSIIVFMLFKNFRRIDLKETSYTLVSLISIVILPFCTLIVMLRRIIYMFFIFQIASVPMLVNKENKKYIKLPLMTIYIMITIMDFINFFQSETYHDAYSTFNTIFSAPNWI